MTTAQETLQQEIIGHSQAVQHFIDAYAKGQMHHAWLFHGPEGIGKATLCKALAVFLLSRSQMMFSEAAVRKQMNAGVYPDYYYLTQPEGGGEITVEQVRGLQDNLRGTSVAQGMRVAVIDGLEYLNRFAANSLLKMLEEPGEGVVFLTLTHRLHAVLPTIRSRCCQVPCLALDEEAMRCLAAREGEGEPDPKVLSWAQGRYGIYKRMLTYGGIKLPEAVHAFMRAARAGRSDVPPLLIQAWEQDVPLVCGMILTWLHKMRLAATYAQVQRFLNEAAATHLDHKLLLPALSALVGQCEEPASAGIGR